MGDPQESKLRDPERDCLIAQSLLHGDRTSLNLRNGTRDRTECPDDRLLIAGSAVLEQETFP
jgi:hypothetical protein